MVTAHQPGEQEVGRIAAPQGCVFAATAEDLLRLLKGLVGDERFVQARMGLAVPADKPAVGGIGEDQLERYFEGVEEGRLAADLFQDRVRGHRDRLDALRERETDLTARLATQAHTPPDGAALARLSDQLEAIVADENPEQAKELLRLLVKDIQVHNRRRIIPTYRIPAAVRAIPRKVGGTGLEPVQEFCDLQGKCVFEPRLVP